MFFQFRVQSSLDFPFLHDFDHLSEPDVDLENQYYNSKSLKEKDPKAALESFQRVLDLENGEKGTLPKAFSKWGLQLFFR